MKYLIICSYYPPDSEISAVRPYMFAKYLSLAGNEVTVLRSGKIISKPDNSLSSLEGVRVVSYLGDNCDAVLFERGEYQKLESKETYAMIPKRIKRAFSPLYHAVLEPIDTWRRIKRAKENFAMQKEAIDHMEDRCFDIVFSTYSELENIFAGDYAAHKFGAKWIQDFRDPIVAEYKFSPTWNCYANRMQKYAIKRADLCTTVAESLSQNWRQKYQKKIFTLYNGYDQYTSPVASASNNDKVLRICYTGQLGYEYRDKALNELAFCLQGLVINGNIDSTKIRFEYAGSYSDTVLEIFDLYGIRNIVEDHGQVKRSEASKIQIDSDIFLVLSWNTKKSQGVLTGKFYEGIRAKKPILAIIAGNLPHSELKQLNGKYNYGFCYEICDKDQKQLMDYLLKAYTEKTENGKLNYSISEDLEKAFRYDQITEQLIELSEQLKREEKVHSTNG